MFAMHIRVPSAACSSGWMWTSVKWTKVKSAEAAKAARTFSAAETAPSAPTVRNERLFKRSIELIPEAQHHHVHVRDAGVGLPRRREQLAVGGLQVVREAALRVQARAREDLIVDETLRHTPVVVEQVAEVRDVETDLAHVAAAGTMEDVLHDAEVDAADQRVVEAVPFRVLASVRHTPVVVEQ